MKTTLFFVITYGISMVALVLLGLVNNYPNHLYVGPAVHIAAAISLFKLPIKIGRGILFLFLADSAITLLLGGFSQLQDPRPLKMFFTGVLISLPSHLFHISLASLLVLYLKKSLGIGKIQSEAEHASSN